MEAVTRYADLEGWWKFEDNLNDSSGNDRTGAHSGTNKYENLSTGNSVGTVFGRTGNTSQLPDIKESRVVLHVLCLRGSRLIKMRLQSSIGVKMLSARNGHFVRSPLMVCLVLIVWR